MRRALLVLFGAALLVGGLTVPVSAETDSVSGQYADGPITKLWVRNGDSAIVAKVYGDGGRQKVHFVEIIVARKSDGKSYAIQAGWYFDDWTQTMSWASQAPSNCAGVSIRWNSDGRYWKFVVPRSCVPNLTNTVRAKAYLSSLVNNRPGATPFTDWLSRG
jgi:hypothetical protein